MQKTRLPRVSTAVFAPAGGDAPLAARPLLVEASSAAPRPAAQLLADAYTDIKAADHAGILASSLPHGSGTGARCEAVCEQVNTGSTWAVPDVAPGFAAAAGKQHSCLVAVFTLMSSKCAWR